MIVIGERTSQFPQREDTSGGRSSLREVSALIQTSNILTTSTSCAKTEPTTKFLWQTFNKLAVGSLELPITRSEPIQLSSTFALEAEPSILWFATIQCGELEQNLTGLTPKDRFIPAEPIEDEVGQIGEA